MRDRELDLLVYGATGFTGRLVAEYVRQVRPELRWGIGGRSADKLAAVRDSLPHVEGAFEPEVLVASSDDSPALEAMCARTRVVLTTAGPFARLAPRLAAACVAQGSDYLDITGEPDWVHDLISTHHEAAHERGLRMIPCCGFDSIPHDLGALFAVLQLSDEGPVCVREYLTGKGRPSGGTWNSLLEYFGKGHANDRRTRGGPSRKRRRPRLHRSARTSKWGLPLPTVDPIIVKRSARLSPAFGPEFTYELYLELGSIFGVGGVVVGAGALLGMSQIPPLRRALGKLRPRGEGPSEREREESWFRATFVAEGPSRSLRCKVSGRDPGYGGTAIMCTQAALCLVEDRDRLPDVAGVVTPASALGELLIERLDGEALEFRVIEG